MKVELIHEYFEFDLPLLEIFDVVAEELLRFKVWT